MLCLAPLLLSLETSTLTETHCWVNEARGITGEALLVGCEGAQVSVHPLRHPNSPQRQLTKVGGHFSEGNHNRETDTTHDRVSIEEGVSR